MNSLLKESSQEEYSDLSFSNSKKNENSYRILPFKINFEYKNLTKSIKTFKDYIKGKQNIQKKTYLSPNKIFNNESQNNSEISTSFSTFDFLSKNELISLRNQSNKIKNEIDKIIENENKTNRKITELENKLLELKSEKNDINKELENYLSNKESLEEILNNKINEINNNCSLKSLLNNVQISINDIQLSNKKNFYNDLISLFETFNVKIQNKTKIKMTDILNKIYNEIGDKNYLIKNAKNVINNFFNPINELFHNILNDRIQQENLIYLILKYILKID